MSDDLLDMPLDEYMKSKTPAVGQQGKARSNAGGRGRGRGRGGNRGRGRQTGGGGSAPRGPRNFLARDGDDFGPMRNARRGRYNRNEHEPYQTRADTGGRWSHDQYETPTSSAGGAVSTDGKIIISNLDASIIDDDLKDIFSECGPIESYRVHYDRDGRSLGTGEVVFSRPHHATKAVKEFDTAEVDGVPITVRLTTTGVVAAPRVIKKSTPAPVQQFRAPPRNRAPRAFGGRGNNRGRRGGRGRGRGGGGRGGGGRGGGGRGGGGLEKKSKEDLDKEMDEWNAKKDAAAE